MALEGNLVASGPTSCFPLLRREVRDDGGRGDVVISLGPSLGGTGLLILLTGGHLMDPPRGGWTDPAGRHAMTGAAQGIASSTGDAHHLTEIGLARRPIHEPRANDDRGEQEDGHRGHRCPRRGEEDTRGDQRQRVQRP